MTLATSYKIVLDFGGWFSLIETEYQIYTSILFLLFFKPHLKNHFVVIVMKEKGSAFFFPLVEELTEFETVTQFALFPFIPRN